MRVGTCTQTNLSNCFFMNLEFPPNSKQYRHVCIFLKAFEDLLSGSGAHSICLNYSFLEMLAIKLLKEENNRAAGVICIL